MNGSISMVTMVMVITLLILITFYTEFSRQTTSLSQGEIVFVIFQNGLLTLSSNKDFYPMKNLFSN